MRLKTVLFDFDGTVFDTVEGITKSIQYALRKHGREEPLERLRCFAGPPLVEKFMEVYGVTQSEAEQLVVDFRERYVPVGIYESAPFPGIRELLAGLRAAGLLLGVATSKPQTAAELLLRQAGLASCFDAVVGSSPGLNNEKKWEIVRKAMGLLGSGPENTVLVGDTKYDAIGAARCGIPCVGVAWGYAEPGELEAAGAGRVVKTMEELKEFLIQMKGSDPVKKIVLMEGLGISAAELEALEAEFAGDAEFVSYARSADTATLIEEAKNADGMILANMPMPAEVIRACPKLRFINIAFTGVDHVGLEAARERGICVSNASGYSTEAVAELVLGAVLSFARNLRQVEDRCRAGGVKDGLVGWELRGKTVGVVGLGKIGTRTAELFHAFGCRVLAHSRTVHADAPDFVEQVELEELLRASDIVSLHCPLTEASRGLIGARELGLMKPTALLVNAARGPVVDEAALAAALERGELGGACVDVFAKEPPLTGDQPLLRTPNTLVTPHVAFATRESMSLRARIVFDNLRAWLDGAPINLVP